MCSINIYSIWKLAYGDLLVGGSYSYNSGDILMKSYIDFLNRKHVMNIDKGIFTEKNINSTLYPFQKAIVRWALRKGRAAIWADCGLGKTPMQLEWARIVNENTMKPVLILAPLAVAQQTIREGKKFGVEVTYARNQGQAKGKIIVTNYEMLDHFEPQKFSGVVLDESSIIKNYAGKFRNQIIDTFSNTPFKLACTATPSPNDYMELGNHSEFIGAMTRSEMLTTFFVHDGGTTSSWRLKRHAEDAFWKWLSSWAVMVRKPSDIGFDDADFILPPLEFHRILIDDNQPTPGFLISMPAISLEQQRRVKRASLKQRSKMAAEIALSISGSVVVWCELNDESRIISQSIGCPEIKGSDSIDKKEHYLMAFADKSERIVVTKPSIAGYGMNWQHCAHQIFCNLTHSYESLYQAIRRSWRFGQKQAVHIYQIMTCAELPILENIQRKQIEADRMTKAMKRHMMVSLCSDKEWTKHHREKYDTIKKIQLPKFLLQGVDSK